MSQNIEIEEFNETNNNLDNIVPISKCKFTEIFEPKKGYDIWIVVNQAGAIKKLFESLKCLIYVEVKFTPSGIVIINSDKMESMRVVTKLHAYNFEEYRVAKEVTININVYEFYRNIESAQSGTLMTIYMYENNDGMLKNIFLGIKIEDPITQHVAENQFRVDPVYSTNTETYDYLNRELYYNKIFIINSDFLYKKLKNIKKTSNIVNIEMSNRVLHFRCVTGNSRGIQTISESKNNMSIIRDDNPSKIVSNDYGIDNLVRMSKVATMSKKCKNYMDNDLPWVIEYDVSKIGSLQIFIECVNPK